MNGLLLLSVVEEFFRPREATPETVLEPGIPSSLLDVCGDGSTDHFRYRLIIHARYGLELLGLVCREADRHGLCGFHGARVAPATFLVNNLGIVLPCYHHCRGSLRKP